MEREITNGLGKILISRDVIAAIAGLTAIECYGIVGMASRKMVKDGIAELLGRESLGKGVEVVIDGDHVYIELFIVVGYGVKISEVGHNVISQVKYAVEKMTGLQVAKITINVQGVRVGNIK